MGDKNQERASQDEAREHLNDEVLNAYLDRTDAGLSPVARSYAEAHLATCAACRAALGDLETTLAMLQALPQVPLRRSFILTPEAAAAVGGPRQPRRPFGWVWPARWATALATLIFAITIGLDLGERPAAPDPTAAATVVALGVTPTPETPCRLDPTLCGITAAGLTPTIFPTPTAVPRATRAQASADAARVDWRPAQVLSGLIAVGGALFGFVLPPILRRRPTTLG